MLIFCAFSCWIFELQDGYWNGIGGGEYFFLRISIFVQILSVFLEASLLTMNNYLSCCGVHNELAANLNATSWRTAELNVFCPPKNTQV